MRKLIGSPKYHNLTATEFEAWMEWFTRAAKPSNFHRGMYFWEVKGKLEYLDIPQLLEYWYYEISGFSLEAQEKNQ